MIKAELSVNGGQILISDFTIVNDFGLICIFKGNEKLNWDEWTDHIGGHSLESAIKYCLEQSNANP